jgi:hypothetical protein
VETPQGQASAQRKLATYNATSHGKATRRDYASRPTTERRKWLDNLRRREEREGVWVPLPANYESLVLEIFEHRCARCDATAGLELDHHKPLQDGFPLYGNSVPLFRSCNAKKHARKPERFYEGSALARIEERLSELRRRLEVPC